MEWFNDYITRYVEYDKGLQKASGMIYGALDASLKVHYGDNKWIYDPSGLWIVLQTERERGARIDGRYLFQRLTQIRLSEFDSARKYFTETKRIAAQLESCGVEMGDQVVAWCMMEGFPDAVEWTNFTSTIIDTKYSTSPEKLMERLEPFEATLRRNNGTPDDSTLFAWSGTRCRASRQR